MIKLWYRYFVSYAHSLGFGSMELYRLEKIKTFKSIESIKNIIEQENDIKSKSVIVLNYQLMGFSLKSVNTIKNERESNDVD